MLGKRFPNTRIGSGLQTIIVDHPHASDLTASSMQGTEWMTGVRAYYFGKYGDPDREAQFSDQSGKKIEVYKWAKNRTGEGVTIYATDGANNCLGDAAMGCEFFIGLTPDVDEIVEAVAEAGLCGNGTSEIPASGDTITLAYPLWKVLFGMAPNHGLSCSPMGGIFCRRFSPTKKR